MPLLLPAVTVPSLVNAAFSSANFSIVDKRGCSSVSKVLVLPLPKSSVTGIISSITYFLMPASPNAIVQKIYKDVNLVLNDSAVKERFAAAGMEVIADTPEQMKIKIEAERARLKVLIKERKIYIE